MLGVGVGVIGWLGEGFGLFPPEPDENLSAHQLSSTIGTGTTHACAQERQRDREL